MITLFKSYFCPSKACLDFLQTELTIYVFRILIIQSQLSSKLREDLVWCGVRAASKLEMFRTKKDVDKHVQDIHSKIKQASERNLKGYSIAKLYFGVSSTIYILGYLFCFDSTTLLF